MPVIFNDEQRISIRNNLLINGFKFIKKYGLKKTSVDEIAKSCGIAKGTFYNFFDSKEQFVLEIILNNRNKLKTYFQELLDENGYLDKINARQYLERMVDPENNPYLYLTAEDLAALQTRLPQDITPKEEQVKATTTMLLNCIKDKQPSCDWRVVANYIKIIALASLNKDKVIEEALYANISGILELTINEIYGQS